MNDGVGTQADGYVVEKMSKIGVGRRGGGEGGGEQPAGDQGKPVGHERIMRKQQEAVRGLFVCLFPSFHISAGTASSLRLRKTKVHCQLSIARLAA